MSNEVHKDFLDKVVLITGAASGIGAACAFRFGEMGAKLALVDLDINELNNNIKPNIKTNNEILLIKANLGVDEDLKKVIEETILKFGRINILINNAGIGIKATLEETSTEQFDNIFNINVRSVFILTKLTVPYLQETKGVIINLSSVVAKRVNPEFIVYSMTKAAINSFTECVALQLASKGVRCNSVNPGTIDTNFFKHSGFLSKDVESFKEKAARCHPLGRIGTVHDVIKVIIFLADDKNNFITGAHFPVDGGRSIA